MTGVRSDRRTRLVFSLGRIPSGVILFFVVLILFSSTVPYFLSVRNFTNILLAGSPLALFAIGVSLVMLTNRIDLSLGACTSFVSVLTALFIGANLPVWVSLALGLLAALGVALLNGAIVAHLRLPAFIVTLGTMGLTTGLALLIGGGQTLYWEKNWFNRIALEYFLSLPLPFWIVILLFSLVVWILHQTEFGNNIYAIGSNEEALRLCGVNIQRHLIAVFLLHGLCVGIAALMLTSRVASGNPIVGVGLEFEAIAAAAIGGVSFSGGLGHPGYAMVSAMTITMLLNGLSLMGLHTSLQYVFVGLILIVGMSMNILLERFIWKTVRG